MQKNNIIVPTVTGGDSGWYGDIVVGDIDKIEDILDKEYQQILKKMLFHKE